MKRLISKVGASMKAVGHLIMNMKTLSVVGVRTNYKFECFDKDGNLKWVEEINNIVVNVGLDDWLDKYLKGSAYTAAFFIGLKGTGAPVAGDTMPSHAGWATITPYSDATDPALTLGAVSGQSVDNSASKASFAINATSTIFGGFIKDNNTKGGATGLLLSAVDFAASRAVINGDTLNVTSTLTMASV